MRLNSDFGTAFHALLIISEQSKVQKVTSDVIADFLGTTPVLVRRLLSKLKKAGFISIAPRKEKEGTTLAMQLSDITLFDLFAAVEPDYMNAIHEPTTRLAKCSQTGVYSNQILTGYVNIAINSLKESFGKITLADALAELKNINHESPYENQP